MALAITLLAMSHHGRSWRRDEQHGQGHRMAGAVSHDAPGQQVCCMPGDAGTHAWSNPSPEAHSRQTAAPCKVQTL